MCKILEVSRQGYNKWLKSKDKPYKHKALLAEIYKALDEDEENNDNYGVYRIFLYLRNNKEYKGSYPTICRVCRVNGLTIKKKRKPNGITEEDRKAEKSENIINQDFTAEKPGEKLLSDISEVQCSDGKLYVAPVLDCFDGAIIGLAMDDNMRADLCINSLENAGSRYKIKDFIFHSDRGSQFTSVKFRATLNKYGATQSMSNVGRCYDNARMESFFATLKKEKLYRIKTENLTMETVKTIIWRFIFSYYNRRRIYTTNDGWPLLVYMDMYYKKLQVA